MKIFLIIISSLILNISCEKNPISNKTTFGELFITTDKNSYSQVDSVLILMDNKSGHEIILGYRCSEKNLEMYFQKKVNDKWSENQWFDYMSLKCMTILKYYKNNEIVKHSIVSLNFKNIGTFRLVVPYHIPEADTTILAVSNSFEIN